MLRLSKFPISQAFGVAVPRIDAVPNHRFTHHYSQIEDYRFCQDSVILPWYVAQVLPASKVGAGFRALDLGAGCGVVGLELAHYLPNLQDIDFLEIQDVFKSSFVQNIASFLNNEESADPAPKRNFQWLGKNYENLQDPVDSTKYDLIISNPPYFFSGDGKPAENAIKNRCRFFIDGEFKTFVGAICSALAPTGVAYFLCKLGGTHGRRSWDEIRMVTLLAERKAEVVADVRGTAVVKIV